MAHRISKSKLLPFWFPLLYNLVVVLNSRGGGKSVTGNVCTPAFGGGDGTSWKFVNDSYKRYKKMLTLAFWCTIGRWEGTVSTWRW